MNDSLLEAQKKLKIRSVDMQACYVVARDDLDMSSLSTLESLPQSFRDIRKVLERESVSDGAEKRWMYDFFYEVGVRLIDKNHSEEISEENIYFQINATFVVKYVSHSKLEEHEVKAFMKENVGYHVWPYWREFVQSTCARVGVNPPLSVPLYSLSKF